MKAIDYGNLIRSITYNMNEFVSRSCQNLDIGKGQFEYFLIIANNPGLNQLEIAEKKNVGKGSVTNAVKKLESQGLIVRIEDVEDRRYSKCYITEAGKAVLPLLVDISDSLDSTLFESFSELDKQNFYTYLKKLEKNASALNSNERKHL